MPCSVVTIRAPDEYHAFIETLAGGHGGRNIHPGRPGRRADASSELAEHTGVEEMEVFYPVRTVTIRIDPGSPDGAGRYRGGLGVLREYTFPDHTPKFLGHHPGRPCKKIPASAACSAVRTARLRATRWSRRMATKPIWPGSRSARSSCRPWSDCALRNLRRWWLWQSVRT